MKIGIIDADLLGRKKHRFPNLACEKISAYYKEQGNDVKLVLNYDDCTNYDLVFVSKVFTDTPIPQWLQADNKFRLGGTGFYFDKAPELPAEIEHHFPDYHLYDNWIEKKASEAEQNYKIKNIPFDKEKYLSQFKEYLDYSIGFLTRGCFRHCPFCVNQKYNCVTSHSPLSEFLDLNRRKICLLDDNFFGFPQWKEMLQELIATGKKFKFKQGLDERLLTEEKCRLLLNCQYDGDFTFAFDNIEDYDLIEEKLRLIRRFTTKTNIKFYVLTGFKSTDAHDITDTFKRVALLLKYGCLPYIMRYQNKNDTPWKRSEYYHMYVAIARWCNQPNIIKKMSFREFCTANQSLRKDKNTLCSAMQTMLAFEQTFPHIAAQYYDVHFKKWDGIDRD